MLHVLNNSGDKLETNAIFIQPTRWCGETKCKNCYVKAHNKTEQASQETHVELFRRFYQSDGVKTNQITISLDTLPLDTYQRGWMIVYFNYIYKLITDVHSKNPLKHYPQVHVTARNIDVVREYMDMIDIKDLDKLTVLSLSEAENAFYAGSPGTIHYNYNLLCPEGITSSNIDKEIERVASISKNFHSIYLILNKSPIGKERTEIQKIRDRARMRSDVLYMRTLRKTLPEKDRKKIMIDRCLQDVINFQKTGNGCCSNVSRFQVWPDGSVSGCPYAVSPNTGPADSADGIINNIREARNHYDFGTRCHLHEMHHSLLKRS